MRITIDPDKCCGYGDCVLAAAGIFELGSDNVAHVLDPEPGPELRDAAAEAAVACPVAAIEIA